MKLLMCNPPIIELDDADAESIDKDTRLLVASVNAFQAKLKDVLKRKQINDVDAAKFVVECNRFYIAATKLLEAFSGYQFTIMSNSKPQ